MTTTKKKTKISLPPAALNNPAMVEVISKGGSVSSEAIAVASKTVSETSEDKLKSFTFKIYESELVQIRDIQAKLPKRDRISIHDFVVAAVKEKISKEVKKAAKLQ